MVTDSTNCHIGDLFLRQFDDDLRDSEEVGFPDAIRSARAARTGLASHNSAGVRRRDAEGWPLQHRAAASRCAHGRDDEGMIIWSRRLEGGLTSTMAQIPQEVGLCAGLWHSSPLSFLDDDGDKAM